MSTTDIAPLRVLVLEDSLEDAELTRRALGAGKLALVTRIVSTEPDFRRALEEWRPNVVLADYSLPTFDGLTALKITRAQYPEVPVIFVSGSIGEEQAIEVLKQGATDYVLKHRLTRLTLCVERALREAKERADRQQADTELRAKVDELTAANRQLEQFNRLMVGREQRMVELKAQINRLSTELGRPAPYEMASIGDIRPEAGNAT